MSAPDLDALRDRQRAMWAAGDYPTLSTVIAGIGEETAQAVAAPGVALLDLAAGHGNVAIPAAALGAEVTALDLTPELIEAGKARAAAAGVQLTWVEGDAEALPFADASFDAVSSNFGVMFAPRHEVVVGELARVARPGARIALTSWALDGYNGQMFVVSGRYSPPPPEGVGTPPQWGEPDHIRELLEPYASSVDVERREIRAPYVSVDAAFDFFVNNLGPIVLARPGLEAAGRWDDFARELHAVVADNSEPAGGGIELRMAYLATRATRA